MLRMSLEMASVAACVVFDDWDLEVDAEVVQSQNTIDFAISSYN